MDIIIDVMKDFFKTSNLPLAAYLSYLGFSAEETLYGTSRSGRGRIVFCFNDEINQIKDNAEKFFSKAGLVEPIKYYEHTRKMKTLLVDTLKKEDPQVQPYSHTTLGNPKPTRVNKAQKGHFN